MSTVTPHLNPRAAAAQRLQRTAADVAQHIATVNARRVARVDAGTDVLLALAVGAAAAWALYQWWAVPCAAGDAAMCMAAVIRTRPGWLHRALLGLRALYLRRLIASAQADIEFQDQQEDIARWEIEHLPRLRQAARQQIAILELQLMDIDLSTRGR